MKSVVAYCPNCNKKTKHVPIQCNEGLGWRIFENIFTFGAIAASGYNYECECSKCGEINTIKLNAGGCCVE